MNEIYYLDNSYLQKKPLVNKVFSSGVFSRKATSGTIYFHDFYQTSSRAFKPHKYFSARVFLTPTVLASMGLFLIFISLVSPIQAFFATSGTSSYPPKLADNQTATLVSQSKTVDTIVAAKVEKDQIILISNQNVEQLNLPGTVQWPVRGLLTNYYSSSHKGIDIASSWGTPLHPLMEGVVSSVIHSGWGYGNYVTIKHAGGLESLYGHMSTTNVVAGQRVYLNTTIGQMGSTGWSTGSHLMLVITRNGVSLNPLSILPR